MPQTGKTLPFEFIGGSPAVDFVNTATWRNGRPLRGERLTSYARVVDWASESGLISAGSARAMRRAIKRDPAASEREFAAALRLRAALHRLFWSLAAGEADPLAMEAMNRQVRQAMRSMDIQPRSGSLQWCFGREESLSSIRHRVTWDAARLLTSPDCLLIRRCADKLCSWVFIDQSRRRNRRWCVMGECGSREKSRRYYRRKKAERG